MKVAKLTESRLLRACAGITAGLALVFPCLAQTYVPGATYYDRSNYIQYSTGDLPFILSAPHGGTLNPAEIPDRTNCPACSGWDFTTATDTATDDIATRVRTALAALTGHLPHIVICHLDRSKIDCNRAIDEGAEGNLAAMLAWSDFQDYIDASSNAVIQTFGRGFYIDQHGQGHPEQRLELGYLLDKYELTNSDATLDSNSKYKNESSIRRLANTAGSSNSFAQLLRGPNSFGEWMVEQGYPSTPSYTTPMPFTHPTSTSNFFNGGYNTAVHGSDNLGPLDALQIEANYTGVRDSSANRQAYAQALARVVENFFARYYTIGLRTCAPSPWTSGGGNWSTASRWGLGILPVSSNLLFFAGPGGSTLHDLAALASSNGVISALVFSNAATGPYVISGAAVVMDGGITSDNAFTNTINNNVALPTACPIAVNAGTLAINGVLTGGGFTKAGAGTLALTAINACADAVTNLAGTISFNATSTPGTGPLVLAGGNLLDSNTRSSAPLANPLIMTGDTIISGNSLLTNSSRVFPFSANSIVTAGGTLTLRNAGANPFSSNNYFFVRFTGGGFDFSQPIVIGSPLDLPVDVCELESYNDESAGDQLYSGPISGRGIFRRDAASAASAGRTILSGSNSYSGGTLVNAGTVLVRNTAGSGTGSGTVSVAGTGALGGNGAIAGTVVCSGIIFAGQGTGKLTIGGGLDLSSGGTNVWTLSALTESGEGSNFDQILLNGGSLKLGESSALYLAFTNGAMAPANTTPFWMRSHSWKIISLTGGATNSSQAAFPAIVNAVYATGRFTNRVDASGSIILSYLANPAARPALQSSSRLSSDLLGISAATEANRTYVLQSTTDLSGNSWMPLSTNVAAGSLLVFPNIPASEPQRFYRLVVVP